MMMTSNEAKALAERLANDYQQAMARTYHVQAPRKLYARLVSSVWALAVLPGGEVEWVDFGRAAGLTAGELAHNVPWVPEAPTVARRVWGEGPEGDIDLSDYNPGECDDLL